MNIGDHVRVLEPFQMAFPGVYEITALDGDTATICGDRQFDVRYLEASNDPLEGYTPPAELPVMDQIAQLQAQLAALIAKVS